MPNQNKMGLFLFGWYVGRWYVGRKCSNKERRSFSLARELKHYLRRRQGKRFDRFLLLFVTLLRWLCGVRRNGTMKSAFDLRWLPSFKSNGCENTLNFLIHQLNTDYFYPLHHVLLVRASAKCRIEKWLCTPNKWRKEVNTTIDKRSSLSSAAASFVYITFLVAAEVTWVGGIRRVGAGEGAGLRRPFPLLEPLPLPEEDGTTATAAYGRAARASHPTISFLGGWSLDFRAGVWRSVVSDRNKSEFHSQTI